MNITVTLNLHLKWCSYMQCGLKRNWTIYRRVERDVYFQNTAYVSGESERRFSMNEDLKRENSCADTNCFHTSTASSELAGLPWTSVCSSSNFHYYQLANQQLSAQSPTASAALALGTTHADQLIKNHLVENTNKAVSLWLALGIGEMGVAEEGGIEWTRTDEEEKEQKRHSAC